MDKKENKMKIKVYTEKGCKTIIGNRNTLIEIRKEIHGIKKYCKEYKTNTGEIITDFDIISILEIKKD